jgi:hypothetical protein
VAAPPWSHLRADHRLHPWGRPTEYGLGGHEWVDAAVSGAIGLVAVPPVLLGTAYGIWKENQLDKEVWRVIDERVSAPAQPGP